MGNGDWQTVPAGNISTAGCVSVTLVDGPRKCRREFKVIDLASLESTTAADTPVRQPFIAEALPTKRMMIQEVYVGAKY